MWCLKSTGQQQAVTSPCRGHNRSRPGRAHLLLCCSLAPKDDGLEGTQRRSSDLPKDWRAYRARLVDMERTGKWHEHRPSDQHPLMTLWPSSGSPGWRMHAPLQNDSGRNSKAIGPVKRPVHPSSKHVRQATVQEQSTAAGKEAHSEVAEYWAHSLARPELGCVLVARKGSDAMGFFHKAVVLITSHDEVNGTLGLVLNKRTPLAVNELSTHSCVPGFQQVFGRQRLFLGGPVHLDSVQLLHAYQGLRGAQCVADGLYVGGIPDAVQLVQAGLANASSFILTLGMAGWGAQQLKEELQAGYWHVLAAAPELLLQPQGGSRQSAGTAVADNSTALQSRKTMSHSAYLNSGDSWHGKTQAVPPLQPPPQHPTQRTHCLWKQLLQAAHLL